MINYDLVNDVTSGGDSAATAVGRLATLNAAYPGLRHIDVTSGPKSNSSDLFLTIANQTIDTAAQKMLDADNLIRAGIAGSDGYIDLADAVDPGRTGKWPVSRDPAVTSITPASFTASQSNNTLTVSAVSSGVIQIGASIHGSGVNQGSLVVSQSSGTPGGVGDYILTGRQTLSSRAMTADSAITGDGLHGNPAYNEIMAVRCSAQLDIIRRN